MKDLVKNVFLSPGEGIEAEEERIDEVGKRRGEEMVVGEAV